MSSPPGEEDATEGAAVYVDSPSLGWIPCTLLSVSPDGSSASVRPRQDGVPAAPLSVDLSNPLYASGALPRANVHPESGAPVQVADLCDLTYLNEPAILYNLGARHAAGLPYTRTGDIVIAVNPYQWMAELYGDDNKGRYADHYIHSRGGGDDNDRPPPHVYEISAAAYVGLALHAADQSVLVSGESGAGKTETVKIMMNHLAALDGSSHTNEQGTSSVVRRVLESNPLLEAFGNARTSRNDNSSRFGKYIQLQFDAEDPYAAQLKGRQVPSCVLAGSRCRTYLLEKGRVAGHDGMERSFHVFYQLLAAPQDFREQVWPEGLRGSHSVPPQTFACLGVPSTDTIEGKADGQHHHVTVGALRLIGVTEDRLVMLYRAICVVLQLSNLVFSPHPDDDDKTHIAPDGLALLSELMGFDTPATVERALTYRTVVTRHERLSVPLGPVAAADVRDAFAKEIYGAAFDWLVGTINGATAAEETYEARGDVEKFGIIGLLDIFGFESFEVNRFEQLCINYANERLQQKFTADTFRSVQDEYAAEGLPLGELRYEDNAGVLGLIEGRMGLIAILNEECNMPKGNDATFVSKVYTWNEHDDIHGQKKAPPGKKTASAALPLVKETLYMNLEFGIRHYAGLVRYHAAGFVKKNMDNVPSDLVECAGKCGNMMIQEEITKKAVLSKMRPKMGRRKRTLSKPTVWNKFRGQLGELMEELGRTRSRYVRCIKPNKEKKPEVMDNVLAMEQLRCAGVV
eukprot:CAMPEP_0194317724 /NCGR_PEP_ID=MMETSP0171-20130528/14450_1 /TAXON_ID=218684 /ORGANISM="Corethron pennatum, Strain L29A3" /LENGTH=743 /DNA_ID=CAMNT_0039074427 /DNA_START=42 /DNA_END=2269 /DNA_ORIENTATION=-